jgi:hypothetical protein
MHVRTLLKSVEWVRFQVAAYGVSCRVRIGSVEILRANEARFTPGQDLDSRVRRDTHDLSRLAREPDDEIRVPRLVFLIRASKLGRVGKDGAFHILRSQNLRLGPRCATMCGEALA